MDSFELQKTKEYIANELSLCATDFWYWAPNYVRTEDEENQSIRYFPKADNFTYLYDLMKEIDAHNMLAYLKSRRLLITWTITLRFLWKAQFAGSEIPGTGESFRGAILSKDEDAVGENMRHLYGVYDRFPKWLQEINPLVVRNKLEMGFKYGGAIKGFSLKQEGPRTYGFSELLFDEMAFQMFARTTWTGARPTLGKAGKMIAVSTPNGKANFFYRIYADPYREFEGVFRKYIPWYANPEHDESWFREMCKALDKQGISREYEGSFSTAKGRAVFSSEFNEKANVVDERPEYIDGRPVLQAWDSGYHFPACNFSQMNGQDQLVTFYSTTGRQESVYEFGNRMREIRASLFPANTKYIHCIPPDMFKTYTGGKSKSGHTSDYDALFNPQTGIFRGERAYRGAVHTNKRLNAIRKMLKLRDDGRAGLVIYRDDCKDLIDGFTGGYAYPEDEFIAKNPDKAEEPEKSDYSHEQDALQMTATAYDYIKAIQKPEPPEIEDDYYIGHKIGT